MKPPRAWGHGSVCRVLAQHVQTTEFDSQHHTKQNWVWWFMPAIPALRKWILEDQKFKTNNNNKFKVILGYIGNLKASLGPW